MPYRDHPDMVVLSGVDDVQIALEESLVTVSTIKGSRFVAPIQVSLEKLIRIPAYSKVHTVIWLSIPQRGGIYTTP